MEQSLKILSSNHFVKGMVFENIDVGTNVCLSVQMIGVSCYKSQKIFHFSQNVQCPLCHD